MWLPPSADLFCSSSPQPSASRFGERIPRLSRNPNKDTPLNTAKDITSPLSNFEARENSPPDRNGPAARPAADRVCASPLIAPRTE